MKVGLISDIHGNATALAAVLDAARAENVQRLICAGDFVGYYYEPEKCMDLLKGWEIESIRGNHEDMLFQLLKDPALDLKVKKKYGSALTMATEQLSGEQIKYLKSLPESKIIKINQKNILVCHGSPWDANYYIYPDANEEIFSRCASYGFDYIILGHTHYPLKVRNSQTWIINPGSVGQPRGKKRGVAHWAIIDIVEDVCVHYETKYDVSDVIAQVKKYDPDIAYLSSILQVEKN